MNKPNPIVVYIVVGALAFALVGYTITLCVCVIAGGHPPENVLSNFKDLGIFASGALASLLARTGQTSEEPTPVKNVNTPDDPVNTHETGAGSSKQALGTSASTTEAA